MSFENNETLWNSTANYWHQRQNLFGDSDRIELNSIILDLLGNIKGKMVLDVGCGTGPMTRFVASQVDCELVGIDLARESVRIANSTLVESIGSMQYLTGDLCMLPFSWETFDAVVASFVLSDLSCLDEALSEIARVGRHGCRLVMSMVHPVAMIDLIDQARRNSGSDRKPHRPFTIRNYFERKKGLYYWTPDYSTMIYHRTVEDYFMALRHAGFNITELFEPQLNSDTPKSFSAASNPAYPHYIVIAADHA